MLREFRVKFKLKNHTCGVVPNIFALIFTGKKICAINDHILIQESLSLDLLLDSFQGCKEGVLYVRGPSGIGKSFSILYLTLGIRKQDKSRVLYINNPEVPKVNHIQYLTKELIYTMATDVEIWVKNPAKFILEHKKEDSIKDILYKYLGDLLLNKDPEKFTNLLNNYAKYCRKNNRSFFLFADQYTHVGGAHVTNPEMHQLISTLPQFFDLTLYGTSDLANLARSHVDPELIIQKEKREAMKKKSQRRRESSQKS